MCLCDMHRYMKTPHTKINTKGYIQGLFSLQRKYKKKSSLAACASHFLEASRLHVQKQNRRSDAILEGMKEASNTRIKDNNNWKKME